MDNLLPGRRWCLGFIVEASQREKVGEEPTSSFRLLGESQLALRCRMIRSWILRQQMGKDVVRLSREKLKMGIFVSFLCTEPGGIDMGNPHPPVLKLLLCLLQSCETHEYNSHWLSELDDLEALGSSLKSWDSNCMVQALCSSGRRWESGTPSWL